MGAKEDGTCSYSNNREYNALRHLISKINEHNYDATSYTNSSKVKHSIGAMILDRKGSVLSVGFNSYIKTHPMQYTYNKDINPTRIFLHAEIDALVKCRGEPHTLVVARIGKDGKIRLAKPCKGCFNAIKDAKIKKTYFTNNNGELVLLNTDISVDDYEDYHSYYLTKEEN